jgi:hypothetical protein
MDHNEHVYDGALGKVLSNNTGLNLQEVIYSILAQELVNFLQRIKTNQQTLGIKQPRDQQCLCHAIWIQSR